MRLRDEKGKRSRAAAEAEAGGIRGREEKVFFLLYKNSTPLGKEWHLPTGTGCTEEMSALWSHGEGRKAGWDRHQLSEEEPVDDLPPPPMGTPWRLGMSRQAGREAQEDPLMDTSPSTPASAVQKGPFDSPEILTHSLGHSDPLWSLLCSSLGLQVHAHT